jgi:hypothetical protein
VPRLRASGKCDGFSVKRLTRRGKVKDLPPGAIVVTAEQLDEMTKPFDWSID